MRNGVDLSYQFALERLPRSKSANLYAAYTKFEKQHGNRTTVEATVWSKRRIQYEEEVANDPFNYDTWFDFARLEEDALRALRDDGEDEDQLDKAIGRVREVYERAVANVPLANEKRLWRRYIFLWLFYAVFEEMETKVTFINCLIIDCLTPLLLGLRSSSRYLQGRHLSRATQAIYFR